ncbi:MFS transporter, PHS family, inorganic phosphate transporter [Pseudohyphozyma bogoriensis]|nr:MFS transporter, PHS family, inorganic phosphate transporter [Pseudohyphozyma bogoriensis]
MSEHGISDKGASLNDNNVVDLNAQRRAALAEIDNAKFGWFHVRAVLVAGVGFYTDAYDIFAISLAATMIGYVYRPGSAGALTANQDLGIKIATPVGTLIGQLLFGWLADVYGRKRMYGIELMIIIIATIGQAVAGHGPGVSIIGVLVMWRFIMGVGIGGDYPLSATITSEYSAVRIRGRMMTAVFASQGWGQFSAAIVALVVVSAFKKQISNDPATDARHIDYCWRLLIGLGAVPGAVALYFRLTLPETPRFTMDVERNVKQASTDVDAFLLTGGAVHDYEAGHKKVDAPKATRRDFWAHFSKWENGKVLFGTAYSWFALDVAFYGLGLNSSIILQAIGYGSATTGTASEKRFQTLYNLSVGNIILSVAGLIPGYWVSFIFIDKWGRKPIQIMGFCVLTVTLSAMGFGFHKLQNVKGAFVFLYCITNFFQNFGPNTTTFIVPGEIFPTRYRSTAHGISAASGKFGAIIAQIMAFKLKDRGGKNNWINHVLEIFALFMLTGIFSSLLIPETKGKSLEELSGEEQDNATKALYCDVTTFPSERFFPPNTSRPPFAPGILITYDNPKLALHGQPLAEEKPLGFRADGTISSGSPSTQGVLKRTPSPTTTVRDEENLLSPLVFDEGDAGADSEIDMDTSIEALAWRAGVMNAFEVDLKTGSRANGVVGLKMRTLGGSDDEEKGEKRWTRPSLSRSSSQATDRSPWQSPGTIRSYKVARRPSIEPPEESGDSSEEESFDMSFDTRSVTSTSTAATSTVSSYYHSKLRLSNGSFGLPTPRFGASMAMSRSRSDGGLDDDGAFPKWSSGRRVSSVSAPEPSGAGGMEDSPPLPSTARFGSTVGAGTPKTGVRQPLVRAPASTSSIPTTSTGLPRPLAARGVVKKPSKVLLLGKTDDTPSSLTVEHSLTPSTSAESLRSKSRIGRPATSVSPEALGDTTSVRLTHSLTASTANGAPDVDVTVHQ